MKFDAIKKVSLKKKAAAPKKVLKQKGALQSKKNSDKGTSALATLRAKGSRDNAAAAFMAKWDAGDDE